jgi:hypothetical protein
MKPNDSGFCPQENTEKDCRLQRRGNSRQHDERNMGTIFSRQDAIDAKELTLTAASASDHAFAAGWL